MKTNPISVGQRIASDYAGFVNSKYDLLSGSNSAVLPHDAEQRLLSLKEKTSCLRLALRDSADMEELLLYEFAKLGKFRHACVSLGIIKPHITKDKFDFYANLIKEQAKRNSDGATTGHAWLVRAHERGPLKGCLSDEELREFVNTGFWEVMSTYFYPRYFRPLMEDTGDYDAVMSCSRYLDFSKTEEFRKKFALQEPLKPDRNLPWPDFKYVKAVDMVLGKLTDRKTEAWLLCPIIEQIVNSHQPLRMSDLSEIDELKPYLKYLRESVVKAVVGDRISYFNEKYPE